MPACFATGGVLCFSGIDAGMLSIMEAMEPCYQYISIIGISFCAFSSVP